MSDKSFGRRGNEHCEYHGEDLTERASFGLVNHEHVDDQGVEWFCDGVQMIQMIHQSRNPEAAKKLPRFFWIEGDQLITAQEKNTRHYRQKLKSIGFRADEHTWRELVKRVGRGRVSEKVRELVEDYLAETSPKD